MLVIHPPDRDRILRDVAQIAFSDICALFDEICALFDEHGRLRPLQELPEKVVAPVAALTIGRRKTGFIQGVRLADKSRALRLLWSHLELLRERDHLCADAEVVAILEAARTRPPGPS